MLRSIGMAYYETHWLEVQQQSGQIHLQVFHIYVALHVLVISRVVSNSFNVHRQLLDS
jgi:hypothetical protein